MAYQLSKICTLCYGPAQEVPVPIGYPIFGDERRTKNMQMDRKRMENEWKTEGKWVDGKRNNKNGTRKKVMRNRREYQMLNNKNNNHSHNHSNSNSDFGSKEISHLIIILIL